MENTIEIEESKGKNKGFTLIELLIVIVILGILAAVTVFAVRGITDQGKTSACGADKATLRTSVETYYAQWGTATGIPATTAAVPTGVAASAGAIVAKPATATWTAGATPAETLLAAGFLRTLPTKFFVGTNGDLYVLDAACGTLYANIG